MGTKIPPEPFEIDPAKRYNVTCDLWLWPPGEERCGGIYQGKNSAIRDGWYILQWIENNWECTNITLVYPPLAGGAERIFSIVEV